MTSLDDLPDELLHRIIESLALDQFYFLEIETYYKPFRNPSSSHPVDSVSLVNRRLRRLSLPILFRKVSIRYVDDAERIQCLMEVLKYNMHLMPLIRELSVQVLFEYIDGKKPVILLLAAVDVLSRCTGLERLDLPRTELGRGDQRPIIEALNNHPSDNIRLQFMSVKFVVPESFNALRSISLSRVICHWKRHLCSDQKMKTLLAQGLSIQSIWLPEDVDDSWMDMTYPGLTEITGWNGNERSLQSTIDFLLRHPLLEEIGLDETHKCDLTPWHVAFASKLYPYSFKIAISEDSDPWFEGNNRVVKIGREWLYDDIKVIFQDDIPYGDVETVETMVRKLSKALPQAPNCSEWLRVGIDFSSPVGEYLTSDDLIGILTRNMSDIKTLNLGKFLSDILTRECSRIHEPGSTLQEDPILAALDSFCERLNQTLPTLRSIVCPQGEWNRWI
ncbi:hypothetical protein K435DRAFT_863525 [Dendrothele bispora CBS 962.96]|uniref:F-box domain-containing protein n=1 Tax=Dendrothele bispora (strain CBS 962.96) TaxID=1314807 RepID=A0A4S8LPG4_DENBC|nr:hypothetical protein K435DRAFT_863525 [Dendrothele bispora CBS 962.96]